MHTLSATKIKTFTTCERQYYYKYHDRLLVAPGGRAHLGKCVHKAIELGFQGQDPFQVFGEQWLIGIEQIEDNSNLSKLYNEGLKMLDLYDFNQEPPLESELGFNLPFPNEEHTICYMLGYFDQVFEGGIVIDLKTGLRKPKLGVLSYTPQFMIYAWAYQQLYGKLPKIYWHHLRTGEKFLADVGSEQILSLLPIVRNLIGQLEYTEDIEQYKREVGTACDWCDFRGPCLGRDD